MSNGFALLELMITLVISSILLLAFNSVLYQSDRAKEFVERRTTIAIRTNAVANQIERDLLGIIFPPSLNEEKKSTEKKEKNQEKQYPVMITRDSDKNVVECRFFTINPFPQFQQTSRIREVIYTTKKESSRGELMLHRTEREFQDGEKKHNEKQKKIDTTLSQSINRFQVQFISKAQQSSDKPHSEAQIVDTWPEEKAKISHIIIEYDDSNAGVIRIVTPLFLKEKRDTSTQKSPPKQEKQVPEKKTTLATNLNRPPQATVQSLR